jgi:hypothetical protein
VSGSTTATTDTSITTATVATNDIINAAELAAGVIVREGLRSMVNTYVPYVCERAPGDPTPFLAHLAKMLPVEGARVPGFRRGRQLR